MPHFRVDDALDGHPKIQRAGDEALGMWVRAGSWCMRYLTDGFVPDWWVKQQPKGAAKARKLVQVGLWHSGAEKDGEKGYQFHEFTGPGRQDSKEKIEADRELARQRQEKSRKSRGESRRESHRDNHRDQHRESRKIPGYTQPNPTHEENSGPDPALATDSNASSVSATPGADLVRSIVPNTLPAATRTELRLQANALLKQGHSPDDVTASLQLWMSKTGVAPRILPNLLADVMKSNTTPAAARAAPPTTAYEAKKARNAAVFHELANAPTAKELPR